ncbi:MAG: hypothetical protein RL095_2635 [Verrucomicrobiota bacterium]
MQRPLDPSEGFSGHVPFENPEKWRRRRLPHFDAKGIYQMITYRLADALPQELVERWREELFPGSAGCQPVELNAAQLALRRRCEAVMDASHGSCILKQPNIARIVLDNWSHFHGQRYEIVAAVVMPNHVHILIRLLAPWTLAKIVHSWKSYTANRIHEELERTGWQPALPGDDTANTIWQREYWDRFIRDEEHFHAAIAYILDNPVKAGLCVHREDWPWLLT